MPIDPSEFHRTFFEESLDSIDVMERGLLRLEQAVHRGESLGGLHEEINRVFRSAHSIKGAGGTFGFAAIAEFSHLLESLLDELRAHKRTVDAALIGLLLRASDALRALVKAARAGQPGELPQIPVLRAELATALGGAPGHSEGAAARETEGPPGGWRIQFRPHPALFTTGNDPLRILRELASLGPVSVVPDLAALPAWDALDPECCYLAWQVRLDAPVPRPVLDDIFAWVSDACDLTVTPLRRAADHSVAGIDEAASTIRVATGKVDALVDMVGELVICQTMLQQLVDDIRPERRPHARAMLSQLARNTRQLQDLALGIRMLPIGFVYGRLPRLVRDVSQQLGKKAELRLSGEGTELDKTIIERMADPLIHILRNAIDHGIESPEERRRAGKPETGTIQIEAYHRGGSVVIEIADDGRGLDHARILAASRARGLVASDQEPGPREIEELIFTPGFSTAENVSDVSGRGVGLDVVRSNIRSLGGGVEILSEPGRGTRFRIRLPLTLAIVDGLTLRVGSQTYIVPLGWVCESVRLATAEVVRPAGGAELYARRGEYLPLVRLAEAFGETSQGTEPVVVIVEADGQKAGLVVDELLGQQQVVIKSLDRHCYKLDGIAAATILGDGRVALILDAAALVRQARRPVPMAPLSVEHVGRNLPVH